MGYVEGELTVLEEEELGELGEELGKVLKFCAANMLSINFKKTNYMIITSPKKN